MAGMNVAKQRAENDKGRRRQNSEPPFIAGNIMLKEMK
jgi:hypothetical protein